MCGLAGVILKQKDRDKEALNRVSNSFSYMLTEANIRGGHATGFALIDKHGDYVICKKPKEAKEFFRKLKQMSKEDFNKIFIVTEVKN